MFTLKPRVHFATTLSYYILITIETIFSNAIKQEHNYDVPSLVTLILYFRYISYEYESKIGQTTFENIELKKVS